MAGSKTVRLFITLLPQSESRDWRMLQLHSLQNTHMWRALVCHSVLNQELHVINWGFSHSSWGFRPLLKPRGSILKETLLSLNVKCPPQAHLLESLVSNPEAFFLKVVESLGGGALLEPFSLTPFPVKLLLLEWRCNLTSQTLASIVMTSSPAVMPSSPAAMSSPPSMELSIWINSFSLKLLVNRYLQ